MCFILLQEAVKKVFKKGDELHFVFGKKTSTALMAIQWYLSSCTGMLS